MISNKSSQLGNIEKSLAASLSEKVIFVCKKTGIQCILYIIY